MRREFFIILTILVLIAADSNPVYGKIERSEREALSTFFRVAGGPGWEKKGNWNGDPGTENTWQGIVCDTNNTMVLQVNLGQNNLKGEIPADLGLLLNLESLVLSDNQLEKVHPPAGKLEKLTILDLSINHLKGPVPAWIKEFTNLKKLDLSNNQLTGTIPSWIKELKNLKELDLGNNQLTGTIPGWIGDLENLEKICLDGNRLEGSIPGELDNLSKLTELRLGHNRLTGKIPSELLNLKNLANSKSNFKFNALYTDNTKLKSFLKMKQSGGDWESTQTIAPRDITAQSLSRNSIKISWKPIDYKEDSGGYRVFYGTVPGGPYPHPDPTGHLVDDKAKNNIIVEGLTPSTRYYFVVKTWTNKHSSNRNKVESETSKEVAAVTRGIIISGKVTDTKKQGVPDVAIEASDRGGKSITDSRGEFNLPVTPGWSGTIKPNKKGYDFSPSFIAYQEKIKEDVPNQVFTAAANTVISGEVTDPGGTAGIPGVAITFSNQEGTTEATTDAKGKYEHIVTYGWTGEITASKADYRFKIDPPVDQAVPDDQTVVTVEGRVTRNFKSIPPKISGKVTDIKDKALAGVTLVFKEEGKSSETKTNQNGEYSKEVNTYWSGSVTPKKRRYIFYPGKRDYKNITIKTEISAEDYKAVSSRKFFISAAVNYMTPSEKDFEDIYGKSILSPEIKLGYKFYRGFHIWGGYGFASANGESRVFQEPTKWHQGLLSMGFSMLGLSDRDLSKKFGFKTEMGVFYTWYQEEMNPKEEDRAKKFKTSGSAVGVRLEVGVIFKTTDEMFTEISMGYLLASDTIEKTAKKLNLGSLNALVGLGLRF